MKGTPADCMHHLYIIYRAKSPHNNAVTQSIVDKVKGQDYPDASKIACKLSSIQIGICDNRIHQSFAQMQLKSITSTW